MWEVDDRVRAISRDMLEKPNVLAVFLNIASGMRRYKELLEGAVYFEDGEEKRIAGRALQYILTSLQREKLVSIIQGIDKRKKFYTLSDYGKMVGDYLEKRIRGRLINAFGIRGEGGNVSERMFNEKVIEIFRVKPELIINVLNLRIERGYSDNYIVGLWIEPRRK